MTKQQEAKEAAWRAADDRAVRREARWALHTPSGMIVGMGTEKPKLSRRDQRNFWKTIRLKSR